VFNNVPARTVSAPAETACFHGQLDRSLQPLQSLNPAKIDLFNLNFPGFLLYDDLQKGKLDKSVGWNSSDLNSIESGDRLTNSLLIGFQIPFAVRIQLSRGPVSLRQDLSLQQTLFPKTFSTEFSA
jgi:hypothetical protein